MYGSISKILNTIIIILNNNQSPPPKNTAVPGTEAYYAAIGGDEAAEAASYSQPYSSGEDVSSPQDARDGRGGTPGTEREAVDWTQQWLASKAAVGLGFFGEVV